MKRYLFIPLFLLCFNAFADFEAIGTSLSLATQFDGFCQQDNGDWEACADTNAALPGYYKSLFYSEATQESVAFGFYDNDQGNSSFVAACKTRGENNWRNCTPDASQIPVGDYDEYIRPAHDGNGNFMIVGDGENNSLIAACRNANGGWYNCSPSQNTEGFAVETLNYTNGQWITLSRNDDWVDGYTIIPALCMDNSNLRISSWQNCDISVLYSDIDGSFQGSDLKGVQYVPASQEWVGLHLGYLNGRSGLYLRSFCRKDNESTWADCTHDIFPSNGAYNFMQNAQGELLVINHVLTGISLRTQILCKKPNTGWRECGENINLKNNVYYGATVNADGKWVLIGNEISTNLSENFSYLTAVKEDDDFWKVTRQQPIDSSSMLMDIVFIP